MGLDEWTSEVTSGQCQWSAGFKVMAHTAPGPIWSAYNSSNSSGNNNTSYSSTDYRSESTEQLDKLLAGLDELSETLPDLGGGLHRQQQPGVGAGGGRGEGRKHPPPRAGTWNGSKNISSGGVQGRQGRGQDNNVSRPGSAAGGAVRTAGDMRSYEEDMDYALESERGETREPGVRGPERRVLVGTDNYGQVYSEGQGTHQPYHTRYDSKPFSYIRSVIQLLCVCELFSTCVSVYSEEVRAIPHRQ